ncbi:glutamate--tRNA ligase family protein [Hymenobacter sp. GOD-10R]|uniref:glutamate--tRNA ligase family protein n=1 Tax=Hymenobacter sp. GOD-10R TaxID=3093922 RepID=UPI002D786609|nr:glutamate--tRNA ligase family protein [Hymenobacter sp. GOD-10R]WRQ27770.1 glutamate--tRNA ligase family protein [Hymenobacter sp. GOD-10R]
MLYRPALVAPVRGRFAPTPSGYLHLGNAVNFVLTWLLVRQAGGSLHLRIDDLDRARLRPAYLANIFHTLDWLGLDYDTGPRNPADFDQHYSQLHYLSDYQSLLEQLRQQPGLVYACTCSRTDILALAPDGRYPGTCRHRHLPLSTPGAAWRVHVPDTAEVSFSDGWQGPTTVKLSHNLGDFVVRKKDGYPAYQIGSIIDDLRLGTTLIVRGADLLPSTAAQLWLAHQLPTTAAFNATRIHFLHHPLLPGPDGHKLSKSQQQPLERGVVAQAEGPQVVYRAVAQLLGLPPEAGLSLESLQQSCP